MKYLYSLLFFLSIFVSNGYAQTITMSSTAQTVSANTTYYDPGGTGNYSNSQDITQTICPGTTGQVVHVTFSAFSTESCCDRLYIFQGTGTSCTMSGPYAGTTLPPTVTSSAANGCLTFSWHSDFSTVAAGWTATLSQITPPPPPINASTSCASPTKLCTQTALTYNALVGTSAPAGNNYGCLFTQPGPSWYYIEMGQAGNIDIHLSASADVDFALWGPYSSYAAATAACGSLPAPIDCSYSTAAQEDINIPNSATGQVYILLVTNYASIVQTFTLAQTGGTGLTDCGGVTGACDISNITLSNISTCNNNGTLGNTADDYYTCNVTVTFVNKPSTGNLVLSGDLLNPAAGTVAVGSTTTSTTHTFTGIQLPANGSTTSLTAAFSAAGFATCTFTKNNIASVSPCSIIPCAANNGTWN